MQAEIIEDEQSIRVLDAQLRYYFHLNPDLLTDEEWAMRVEELNWIRKKEAESQKN